MRLAPVVGFLFTLFASSQITAAPQRFTLGATLSLSGPTANWGENASRGFTLALEDLNASGGINGVPVEVVYEDFGLIDLKRAASAAQKLLAVDKVKLIFTQWTEDTSVVWPIASKQQVPVITIAAGAKDITKGKDFLYRVWPSDDRLVEYVLQYAERKQAKSLCVLVEETGYFQSMRDVAVDFWTTKFGKSPEVQTFPTGTSDVSANLIGFKRAQCESTLYLVSQGLLGTAFRQAQKLGLKGMASQEREMASILLNQDSRAVL